MRMAIVIATYPEPVEDAEEGELNIDGATVDQEVYGPFEDQDKADEWIKSIHRLFNKPGHRRARWHIDWLQEPFTTADATLTVDQEVK